MSDAATRARELLESPLVEVDFDHPRDSIIKLCRESRLAMSSLAELADEVERLRALTTVDDAMVERSSLALHHITCDTAYHECVLDQSVGCRAVARAALEAALGVES